MPSCQLCGEDSENLKKTKIEGAVMKVCSSCSDMGDVIEQKKKKKTKKKSSKTYRPKDTEKLTSNYGEKLKEAREDRKLSIKELADSLNEKASLIKKVEREDLKPEKSLANKLSKELDVTLYVNPEVYDTSVESTDDGKATLGDVAKVKE
jgi:putative transcription factor